MDGVVVGGTWNSKEFYRVKDLNTIALPTRAQWHGCSAGSKRRAKLCRPGQLRV